MTQPVEGLGGEEHLQYGPAYLQPHSTSSVKGIETRQAPEATRRQTYGKEHDGDGQRDGCEDGDPHAQDQRVVRVDPAVGVQKFRFNALCDKNGREGGFYLGTLFALLLTTRHHQGELWLHLSMTDTVRGRHR